MYSPKLFRFLWDVSIYLLLFVNEYNNTKSSSLSLLDSFIHRTVKPVSHQGTGGEDIFARVITTLSKRWHLTDQLSLSSGANKWTFGSWYVAGRCERGARTGHPKRPGRSVRTRRCEKAFINAHCIGPSVRNRHENQSQSLFWGERLVIKIWDSSPDGEAIVLVIAAHALTDLKPRFWVHEIRVGTKFVCR